MSGVARVLGALRRIGGGLISSRPPREAARERRLCALVFDAGFYLDRNPDVAHAGLDPLTHYLQFGAAEGRRPHPLFDPRFYRAQLDAEVPPRDALRHFLTSPPDHLRRPHPLFDPAWYLESNPDVAAAGTNPLVHYLQRGAAEGREPSPAAAGGPRWFGAARAETDDRRSLALLALSPAAEATGERALLTRALEAAGFEVVPPAGGVACGSGLELIVVDRGTGASAMPAAMACHPRARLVCLDAGDAGSPAPGVEAALLGEADAVVSASRPPTGVPWLDLARLRGELAAGEGAAGPGPPRALAALLRRAGIRPPVALGERLEALARARGPGGGDVLVLAIIPWRYRQQRPQQLSLAMARAGRRVVYLDPEFLPSSDPRPYRLDESPADGVSTVRLRCGGLLDIHAAPPSPEQLSSLEGALQALLGSIGADAPTVVVEAAFWLPLVRALPRASLVHDCMDLYRGFANVSPALVRLEEELVREADLVVLSSSGLERWTAAARRRALVRNGCEFARFASAAAPRPRERPLVGYVGAIDAWFDSGLLARCARARPQWEFLLAGAACEAARAALGGLPNLRLLGEVDYEAVPELVAGFDVGVVPFLDDELTRCVNPVKAYEYLAAGKPVVATPLPELLLFPPGLVRVARTADEFLAALDQAVGDHAPQRVEERRRWAAGQGWDARGAEFLAAVETAAAAAGRAGPRP